MWRFAAALTHHGARVDALLRGRTLDMDGALRMGVPQLIGVVIAFGGIYGAAMGSFGGVAGDRAWQVLFAALKIPPLLLVSFALSLPSFAVINTLVGLRDDLAQAVRALMVTQAALTIVLTALAPLTFVWYASSRVYAAAVLFNAALFGIASLAAQLLLRRLYEPLIERDGRHRLMLHGWLVIYGFVGVQMGWVLRPFVGNPDAPTRFFRQNMWGNAYLELLEKVQQVLGG